MGAGQREELGAALRIVCVYADHLLDDLSVIVPNQVRARSIFRIVWPIVAHLLAISSTDLQTPLQRKMIWQSMILRRSLFHWPCSRLVAITHSAMHSNCF